MFFYKVRRILIKKISISYNCFLILIRASRIKSRDKVIFLDISEISLNRYLYSFLKFFSMYGYTIYIPRKSSLLKALYLKNAKFTFMPLLLKEGFIKFGVPNKPSIVLSKEVLSNDYFSSLMLDERPKDVYHVPICEFPTFYDQTYGQINYFLRDNRKRSLFMAGNIDIRYYSNIKSNGIFDIPSRWEVSEFLRKKSYFQNTQNFADLVNFISGKKDFKVILIDTQSDFCIERNELKNIYSSFAFYLALPGVDIPHCHNIIEAISSGCIPVIHKTYANLFHPRLQNGINAIIFEDLTDLDEKIKMIFGMSEKAMKVLKDNLQLYYLINLTPQSVVENLERNIYRKIFIQASGRSIDLLKLEVTKNDQC